MKPELIEIGTYEPDESLEEEEGEEIEEAEQDLPPEFCRYRDEGCELAGSCLECPFPQCIYEEPRGRQRWLKTLRAKEMARLFNTRGKGLKELADMFGVSRRTVQRALKIAEEDQATRGARENE